MSMKYFKIKVKSPIYREEGAEAMRKTFVNETRATIATMVILLSLAHSHIETWAQDNLPINLGKPTKVESYSLGKPVDSNLKPTRIREDYKLRVGDKLEFSILNKQYGFTNPVTIDNQGTVFLDHLEWVFIQGMTVREVQDELKKRYEEDFFTAPRVKLTLIEKASLKFKILGQVANPGFYEVPPGLDIDLLDAIAIAGGYTRIAGKVIFKDPSPQGSESIETFSLKELTKEKTKIPSLDGDETIIIGESIF